MFLRFHPDGLSARLSFLLPFLLSAPIRILAWEDLPSSLTGLDYEQHVWMRTHPRADTAAPVMPAPISVSADVDYLDLLKKNAAAAFDIHRIASGLQLRWHPVAGLDFHSALRRMDETQALGDTSIYFRDIEPVLETQNTVAFPLASFLTPSVTWNWSSQSGSDGSLALRGQVPFGISWAVCGGEKKRRFPIQLKLENYEPLTLPVFFRQEFTTLSLAYHPGLWRLSWLGHWMESRPGEKSPSLYSISDSGQAEEHRVTLGYGDSGSVGAAHANLEGQINFGDHVFRGVRTTQSLYQFGYEQASHFAEALRLDLAVESHGWEGGLFAGTSELRWRAFRPEIPNQHFFWDRNGVLDSYDGNILNLFESQTWLFDGNLWLRQWAGGAWVGRSAGHWRAILGLNYNFLALTGSSHLTKKTTELLLAYSQADYHPEIPQVQAHFVTPELRLSRRWGRWSRAFLQANLAQAIPVHIQFDGDANPSSSPSSSPSSLRGGTRAGIRVGWGQPD